MQGYQPVNPYDDDEPFHLEDTPQLGHVWHCPRCNTTRLEVIETGHWETSARCPDCHVQWVVHEG